MAINRPVLRCLRRRPTPTAVQPPAAANGGTLSLSLNGDPSSLNPILANTGATAAVNRLLFPSLLGRNAYTGQLGPDNAMAQSWEMSPDGLTYTFCAAAGRRLEQQRCCRCRRF